MAKYPISYDLTDAEKSDYDAMDKKIKLGIDPKAERILQSQWIVSTNLEQAERICMHLDTHIGPKDQLLVVSLEMTDKCWRNIPDHLLF